MITLTAAEFILKNVSNQGYYVRPPNIKRESNIAEGVMPGMEGSKRFYTNSQGICGDEFSESQNYHILAVGGSATECVYLDNEEAWPKLTQNLLNKEGYKTWVGNVGKSGLRLTNHLKDAEILLRAYPFMDALVVLMGFNDLVDVLRYSLEGTRPAPEEDGAFYARTAVWKMARKIRNNLSTKKSEGLLVQDNAGTAYVKCREARAKATKINTLPEDLNTALQKYKGELKELLNLGEKYNVRVILMTQPSLWKEQMSTEEEAVLWAGWGGAHQAASSQYYSVSSLKKSLDQFNQTLWDVCAEQKAECIDLDRRLPKDTSIFYDDCHFNVNGSKRVAEIIKDYLLHQAPTKLP